MAEAGAVLAINAGSSSIKFAFFQKEGRSLAGKMDRVGQPEASLGFERGGRSSAVAGAASGGIPAPHFFLDWLAEQPEFKNIRAVGHRVGGSRHPDR